MFNRSYAYVSKSLSLSEAIFLAQQSVYIHVMIDQSMPSIQDSVFEKYGPFIQGTSIAVPLNMATFLWERRIATPHMPVWLTESEVKRLVNLEKQREDLGKCVHQQYIELAHLFLYSFRDLWATKEAYGKREDVACIFNNYVAIRFNKIAKMTTQLINSAILLTSNMSDFERRHLGIMGLDYIRHMTGFTHPQPNCLEDMLASLNILDAPTHFDLMRRAQSIFEATYGTLDEN